MVNGSMEHSAGMHCPLCTTLPERTVPLPSRPAFLVQCISCPNRFYSQATTANGATTGGHEFLRGFSPFKHLPHQNPSRLERLISAVEQLHECTIRPHVDIDEDILLMLTAVPLGAEFQPLANAIATASSKLSCHGMDLEMFQPMDACYWLLDFGPSGFPGAQIVVKPIRTRPMPDGGWKVITSLLTPHDLTPA